MDTNHIRLPTFSNDMLGEKGLYMYELQYLLQHQL